MKLTWFISSNSAGRVRNKIPDEIEIKGTSFLS